MRSTFLIRLSALIWPCVSLPFPLHLQKQKVGFAITVTKDGKFVDGAAVLAYSIDKAFRDEADAFEMSLIAFVHPNVSSPYRSALGRLGYHVIESKEPVPYSAIRDSYKRNKLKDDGCCGAAELIKLQSYRLSQYDTIVHLDADVEVLDSFSEVLKRKESLVYTTDPSMAVWTEEERQPVQGGFLIIKPSLEDYAKLIDTFMNTPFVDGTGWNASKIGWHYGGLTIQGLLPYYYRKVTSPDRSFQLDRCVYNAMADTPDCQVKNVSDIKSAHFTWCQKPWDCNPGPGLCMDLHKKWEALRNEAEHYYGIPSTASCPGGGYKSMDLRDARLSEDSIFVPDASPDVLEPLKEFKFLDSGDGEAIG